MCHIPTWASQMRRYREDKALSQEDVCAIVEVTPKTYRLWEKGKKKPARKNRAILNLELGPVSWSQDGPEEVQ